MGYREAKLADFAATPQANARQSDKSGYLAVTADFDGDGLEDEARILLNEKIGTAYVVAVIESRAKVDTYVLSQMTLNDAKMVGISMASPLHGSAARASGVTIFNITSGEGEAIYFDGEDFSTRVEVSAGGLTSPQRNVR